jgi:thiol-disulfide isomerase/thioredoxin
MQLKAQFEQKQELLAKGHGELREISQDEFLKEVTSSARVLVHFYHRDFERCKIMDMHLMRLAKIHIECKFLKMNAEKAPFFVEKLVVRVLPTVIGFQDGVAFPQRLIGFDGLTSDDDGETEDGGGAFGSRLNYRAKSSDSFPTAAVRMLHLRYVDLDRWILIPSFLCVAGTQARGDWCHHAQRRRRGRDGPVVERCRGRRVGYG